MYCSFSLNVSISVHNVYKCIFVSRVAQIKDKVKTRVRVENVPFGSCYKVSIFLEGQSIVASECVALRRWREGELQ